MNCCRHGHEWTSENILINPKNGARRCRECARISCMTARFKNPERARWNKNNNQCIHLYGLTIRQRDELLLSQGEACKLCGRTNCKWGKGFQNVWHIDHIHGTKVVRGILCAACNMLVGQIEKNPILSQKIMCYLKIQGEK